MAHVILPGLVGSEPPRAILGDARSVDHRDAETWRPAGLEQILPPAPVAPRPGTRAWYAPLVAADIADSCSRLGLRCAARVARSAESADDWRDVKEELEQLLPGCERNATRDASQLMVEGCPAAAATTLAKLRGVDLDAWVTEARELLERAAKGGAR